MKEWVVTQKKIESIKEYENQKKDTLHKLETNEYLTKEERERAIQFFKEGDFTSLKFAVNGLNTDVKWYDSLKLTYLERFCENEFDRYLDSEPIAFDGDIIITDPGYICMEKECIGTLPSCSDFFSYKEEKDYPDCIPMADRIAEQLNSSEEEIDSFDKILFDLGMGNRYFSKQYKEEEKKYHRALAQYDKDNISDWETCDFGFTLENLGITHYMTRDTLYGDWSCTTFDCDTGKVIGQFCADAGLVSVMSLDEVLKYNPGFDYHLNKTWTTTWIKDFKGNVQFVVKYETGSYDDDNEYHKKGDKWEDYSVEVVGHGINKHTGEPINFVGKQTGL